MSNMRDPHLTFIINGLKAAGAKIPDVLSKAIADERRVVEAARELRAGLTGYGALASAWADSVLDDRNPTEDPTIMRAIIGSALATGDIEYAATNAVNQRAVKQVREIQGDILKAFKKSFDGAGRTLKNAHGILGNTNLSDTTAIFQLGTVAVQAYQDAQEARRIIRIIDRGWTGLQALTQFAGRSNPEYATRWADSDINTWEKVRRLRDGWDMTVAGCTLDLAIDADTINERIERLERERIERAHAQSRAERPKLVNYLTREPIG